MHLKRPDIDRSFSKSLIIWILEIRIIVYINLLAEMTPIPQTMKIRRAKVSDSEKIETVRVNTWKTAYKGLFPDAYLQNLSIEQKAYKTKEWLESLDDSTAVYVAEVPSNNVVGFSTGGKARETLMSYQGELWGIYILQEFQKKGIGTLLVKEVVKHLIHLNIESMFVVVLKDSPYRRFYERLGGKFVKEGQREYGNFKILTVAYGWNDIKSILAF